MWWSMLACISVLFSFCGWIQKIAGEKEFLLEAELQGVYFISLLFKCEKVLGGGGIEVVDKSRPTLHGCPTLHH